MTLVAGVREGMNENKLVVGILWVSICQGEGQGVMS